MQTEATKRKSIKKVIAETYKKFSALDAVFANGGTEGNALPLTECTVEDVNEVLYMNVTGVWLPMIYAILFMRTNGGGSFVATSPGMGW